VVLEVQRQDATPRLLENYKDETGRHNAGQDADYGGNDEPLLYVARVIRSQVLLEKRGVAFERTHEKLPFTRI